MWAETSTWIRGWKDNAEDSEEKTKAPSEEEDSEERMFSPMWPTASVEVEEEENQEDDSEERMFLRMRPTASEDGRRS